MAFSINKNKPNQVTIDSKLNKYDLKILEYGAAKLDKINSEFEYRAIINDQLQRPIFVGVSNPNYTPLDSISPYLQKCVLTTEDPSFMTHKGFVTEAFRTSIIKNLQTKKFSRGASTISMQLVKNVFLTRQKTLSRKLEEILLVFILENNQIVNKKRMLEVYFNVIEWGPDVYGIGEASQFYFQKKPKYLSLNECLFLANIIPSPRKFMFQFGGYGSLSGRSVAKNNYITNLMIKRKLLDANDIATRYNAVNISGKARSFLIIRKAAQDTVVRDSIMMPDDDEFEF
jgi:membrane peptidoglycan carboxypeptidase